MTANDEIAIYLRSLLDHEEECNLDGCSACLRLEEIVGAISNKLFSGRIYTEMTIAARRSLSNQPTSPAAPVQTPAPRRRKAA